MGNEDIWIEQARRALEGYDAKLLRQVANRLFRPRNEWPIDELIARTLNTLTNPPVLDRRLKDLPPACRQVLALIGHSRQPCWRVGNLVEMLVTLGHNDGLEPIRTLIDSGLLFPFFADSVPPKQRLKDISLALAHSACPIVFALPQVSARALGEPLWKDGGLRAEDGRTTIEVLSSVLRPPSSVLLEADGLDWPLRLAVLWQTVSAGPLRWTQQGDFFKRDLDRLRQDTLLAAQPHDALAEIPDPGLLVVSMALALGILKNGDSPVLDSEEATSKKVASPFFKGGDLSAGEFPQSWNESLPATLASLWSQLPWLHGWNAVDGWQPAQPPGNPFPGVYLLALLLLGQLGEKEWARPESLEAWILDRHPFWRSAEKEKAREKEKAKAKEKLLAGVITRFLLGVAYPLRLLQATKETRQGDKETRRQGEESQAVSLSPCFPVSLSGHLVRLSPLGRWLLGLGEAPPGLGTYPQTLLVQPTLEILAYRQGLTPELIVRLSRFARWKGVGAACTLQMEPETVYSALEAGETFASLVQVLEQHGMKAMPAAVIESLRTWSNKRDRITVYPAGVLLEFPGPDELAEALARGLPAVRLSDRLAIVQGEKDIDYRHFRLTGTRDYLALPDQCIEVEDDGVTLRVDFDALRSAAGNGVGALRRTLAANAVASRGPKALSADSRLDFGRTQPGSIRAGPGEMVSGSNRWSAARLCPHDPGRPGVAGPDPASTTGA